MDREVRQSQEGQMFTGHKEIGIITCIVQYMYNLKVGSCTYADVCTVFKCERINSLVNHQSFQRVTQFAELIDNEHLVGAVEGDERNASGWLSSCLQ